MHAICGMGVGLPPPPPSIRPSGGDTPSRARDDRARRLELLGACASKIWRWRLTVKKTLLRAAADRGDAHALNKAPVPTLASSSSAG
mmetsp:Transcript_28209/g.69575  ORF Transcript_28209/g.69575 Transcript_28209/m.69575 type:complete len:87 (-) Transcript_28209:4145-4405(-)